MSKQRGIDLQSLGGVFARVRTQQDSPQSTSRSTRVVCSVPQRNSLIGTAEGVGAKLSPLARADTSDAYKDL